MNTCTACHRQLTDSETYGGIDLPMCWDCHSSAMFDGDPPDTINADIYAADAELLNLITREVSLPASAFEDEFWSNFAAEQEVILKRKAKWEQSVKQTFSYKK